jgi:DNA-binding NtrC family response regulator
LKANCFLVTRVERSPGGRRRLRQFELATGGPLFLNEIGEMPQEA